MVYDMFRKYAEGLRPKLEGFVREFEGFSSWEDLSNLMVRQISSHLSYDLVFLDDADNVVAIMVGADVGRTVLLSAPILDGNIPWIVSQIYAGQILSDSGYFRHGTVVAAASCAECSLLEDAHRFLVENTLSRLGIVPDLEILPSDLPPYSTGQHDKVYVREKDLIAVATSTAEIVYRFLRR